MADVDLTNDIVDELTNVPASPVLPEPTKKASPNEGFVTNGGASNGRPPKKLLQFVGFPYKFPASGLVRFATTPSFDEGVEFFEADVRVGGRLPASPQDGPARNFVLLADDADVIYWSRKPPRANREPGGGTAFPFA